MAPADHHDEQKALRGQRGDAGADQGGDKQAGGGAGHRKPGAFQHMGKSSYAGSHGHNPREREDVRLGYFSTPWKTLQAREVTLT